MQFLQKLATVALDFPFRQIGDQRATKKCVQSIPTTVYQTWETKAFGRRHWHSINRFRNLNPDLDFLLYNRQERDSYMLKHWGDRKIYQIYTRALFGPLKADIFRYCIIYSHGGYYFDISKGVNLSITSLHASNVSGLVSFENNPFDGEPGPDNVLLPKNLVIQWGFGFAPRHTILSRHIASIEDNYEAFAGRVFESPKAAILDFSGPRAFTRTVHLVARLESMQGIAQLDVDFDSHGIYSMRGSGSRFFHFPSYAQEKNSPILI